MKGDVKCVLTDWEPTDKDVPTLSVSLQFFFTLILLITTGSDKKGNVVMSNVDDADNADWEDVNAVLDVDVS